MTRSKLRGKAVWLAGVASILPVAALVQFETPVEATNTLFFQPPESPMVLTRTLRKPRPGGIEFVTERSYEIRFVSEAGGFRIDGVLVGVEVQAPPGLAALAAIEKARPDEGMFPLRLDAAGLLVPVDTAVDPQSAETAVAQAGRKIDTLGLSASEAGKARQFVNRFKGSSAQTPWPTDLFLPAPGERSETKSIPLPNGAQGRVRIDIAATTAGPTGLLSKFARKVTTELGDTAQVTEEIWTLRPVSD